MSAGEVIKDFLRETRLEYKLNPRSKEILLGPLTSKLNVYFEGYIAELILGAFIDDPEGKSEFAISVYMLDEFDYWKEKLEETIPKTSIEVPVPYEISSPFRIFVCESQSQIYFFDPIKRIGIILLRETKLLDTRSYITPFRLMVSWIINSVEGEVIHASALSKNGRALLISGEKGSGKSTLALTWMMAGGEVIADDALILIGKRVHAIYSRAKVDPNNEFTQNLTKYSFQLRDRQDAKSILPLSSLGLRFVQAANLERILIPELSDITLLIPGQEKICVNSFVNNSLREIFGGDEVNRARLSHIADTFGLSILKTSSNIQSNIDILSEILSKYRNWDN